MNSRRPACLSLTGKFARIGSCVLVTFLALSTGLFAQSADSRPRAVDLLPERTSVYVQIDDIQQLIGDLKESNFGRMLQDERIAPLITELYGEAKTAFADIEGEVGASLAELQSLPQGEICFAVVTPRRKEPVFALVMDVDPASDLAQRLIDRGRELAEDDGAKFETAEQEGITCHVVNGDDADELIYYVLHEGTFLACNDEKVFGEMMVRWHGTPPEKDRTLAGNRKFVTVMNKCKGTDDLPMAFSFFVDPITLARSIATNEAGAGIFFGALPVLGLDGLSAIGGAALFNEKNYESVFHGHMLLANPRAGILEMIAMKPGFYDPESFVPADVASYVTTHWDFKKFMVELEKIVDTFTNEGTFKSQIEENINQQIGINFEEDFIANLKGRVTYVAWMNDPPTINSQSNALVLQLNEEEKGIELVNKVLDRVTEEMDDEDEPLITEEYKGVTIWRTAQSMEDARAERRQRRRARREGVEVDELVEEEESIRVEMRPTIVCFCFIDDHFIATESPDFLEYLIDTHQGDNDSLADDAEFKVVINEMRTLLDGNLPSGLMYARPDRSLKTFYELIDTDNTRELLDTGAEDNKYLKGLQKVLENNPLPPFEEIAKYFPPQGGFITNDETGFHVLFFQRRAVVEDE